MYGENDATKIITIRISESEYQELKELVRNDNGWYPRPTISSKARKMIQFCLKEHKDRFNGIR